MSSAGITASALTFLPRTLVKLWALAFLSPDRFAPLFEQQGVPATRLGDDLRSPTIRGHKRCLSRRQWKVIVPAGKDAIYPQGPGQADRQLDRANEVLDVALVARRLC